MVTCQYCGASYQEFQTTCSSCGAKIKKPVAEAVGQRSPLSVIPKIRQICASYEDAKEFRPGEVISSQKMKTIEKSFTVYPNGKDIFLFCDTHPFNKGKRGFIISGDGLYWQNNWAIETNRNYLSWEDFAQREIKLDHFTIVLGRGDAIGLAGLGSDEKRDKALHLLTEIRNVLNEQTEKS